MSTYYQYEDAKLAIMSELANRGWTIHGYRPDRSDSMTDYYCPAHWDGIAEKNGYVLVIDHSRTGEPVEIKEYVNSQTIDVSLYDKMTKLRAMTIENGATEGEAASARMRLEAIQEKINTQTEKAKEYKVTGTIPGYMANPPRCNWHLEKDGTYILKGNGILKYSNLWNNYYHYEPYKEDLDLYVSNVNEWKRSRMRKSTYNWCKTEEEKAAYFDRAENEMKNLISQLEAFRKFISKIDSAAGCRIGQENETVTYEKVTVTKYKTVMEAVETASGEIKDGQCFILKSNFNYGHNKGQIFRIHKSEYNGNVYYHAYKLNKKLTKECTGSADTSNHWNTFGDKFTEWIEKGYIAFCTLQEVKKPYEVEKVVKKVVKNEAAKESLETTENENSDAVNAEKSYTYDIKQDVDTRDNSTIWIVKVLESLDKNAYIELNKYMKSLGAYYSKFKHGFLFKTDPTSILTKA